MSQVYGGTNVTDIPLVGRGSDYVNVTVCLPVYPSSCKVTTTSMSAFVCMQVHIVGNALYLYRSN